MQTVANRRSTRPSAQRKAEDADENTLAAQIVSASTGVPVPKGLLAGVLARQAAAREAQKNPAAVALGRLGGLKGGKARAEALSPKKRSAIAKKAATIRWETKEKVLELTQKGLSGSEIAKKLGLSLKSAESARLKVIESLKGKVKAKV